MKNILFVCTGNTCRSSMAEALFKAMLVDLDRNIDDLVIHSAGIYAEDNQNASPGAIIAMENRGIDLKNHRSRSLTKEMVDDADLVLTMTSSHKSAILNSLPRSEGKVYTLKEYANLEGNLDVSDPFGKRMEIYDETAEEIKEALKKVIEKIDNN